jgi:peptide chain release factor 2
VKNYGGLFDPDNMKKRIEELEGKMSASDFWDSNDSNVIITELNNLKSVFDNIYSLKEKIKNNMELVELLKEELDEDIKSMLELEIDVLEKEVFDQEIKLLLSDPYDSCDIILEIHPGAGGTESCDWANMLYRMYSRYCEKNNYKTELIDYQSGDETGIKSVSLIVRGDNCYGYLKCEKGVHRLIRISPFDSNSRRHTSFASVDITPLYQDDNVNIEIKDSDIRVDVYRSSGKGGQGVNTTDSAVRITHLATNIVVTCQNERSQIRNKEIAMTVLKNKLYQRQVEDREKELSSIKGENTEINFGSQIRTYTMHPYSLVKDHRTNTETGNVNKVMDGDIDLFINDCLKNNI